MRITSNPQTIPILLFIFAVFSFFYGFSVDEISMGAGGYEGDYLFVKKSIALFSQNSIFESIKLFSETSNRPPLIYILHKIMNPFFSDETGFRKVVFSISLLAPLIFYFCLLERFKQFDKYLLLLLASVLFFNPFFRTSSFWGLEENYAIISSLVSILFLLKLFNDQKKKDLQITFFLILITLFSSLAIYFDQKFLIIPLICFTKIMLSQILYKFKLTCIFLYTIFSIPYLYLINLWGGIFPTNIYDVGNQFYFHHFGYALSIIAFIFFPFIFLKSKSFLNQLISLFKSQQNFLLVTLIFIYLFFLFFFQNDLFLNNRSDGGGIIKKLSFILFNDIFFKKIFTFFSFFIAWFIIFLFIEKNKINLFLTIYFLSLSLIVKPLFQEYFDPIIFILLFFVYKIDLKLSLYRVYFFYFYFLIFLIGSTIYYQYV